MTALLLGAPDAVIAAKKGKAPAPKTAPVSATPTVVVPKVLADVALPAEVKTPTVPTGKTDLSTFGPKRVQYDFSTGQDKLLARYDLPSDKRYSYAIDHNFWVTEAPRFARYLGLISERLLRCWPGTRPPIRILIDGHAAPLAYAHDSGVIRVSIGLLDRATTTDALAFSLAHEIAHVLYEHQAKRDQLRRAIQKGFGMLSSAAIVSRELQFSHINDKPDIRFRSEFGSMGMLLSGYSLESLSNEAIIPFRQASQEFEADRLAYDLTACAKFSTDGANSAVMLLGEAEQPDLRALTVAAQLGAAFLTNKLIKSKEDDDFGSQLLKVVAKVAIGASLGAAVSEIKKQIQKSMGGTKRAEKLGDYVNKAYGTPPDVLPVEDTSLPALRRDGYWTTLAESAKISSAVEDAISAAQEASTFGAALPTTTVGPSLGGVTRADPRLPISYYYLASSRYQAGDYSGFRQAYEAGSRLYWGFRDLIIAAGKAEFAAKDGAALDSTIRLGRAKLGNIPELLPLDLRLALLKNDAEGAEKIAAKCLSRGGDALYAECVEPMGYDPVCAPKTDGAKGDLSGASLGRQANSFMDLPSAAIAMSLSPPKLLNCAKPGVGGSLSDLVDKPGGK